MTFNSNFRPSERLAVWPGEKSSDDKRLAAKKKIAILIYLSILFLSSPHFFWGGLHVKAKELFICFSKAVVLSLARLLTIIVLPSHEQHNSSGGMRRISC